MIPFFRRYFPDAAREGRAGVLGIVNATPDSFSDGGRHDTPETAAACARRLVAEGADALDVGAESTRPGFSPVPPEEQIRRLLPVLRAVRAAVPGVPISIDARFAEVAAAALENGADLLNDQGGVSDAELAALVRGTGCGVIAMHGFPEHVGERPRAAEPGELGGWVAGGLRGIAARAGAFGIAPEALCLDPGFGFGLKRGDNAEVLAATPLLLAAAGPAPILVGPSRKHFLAGMYPTLASRPDEATARFCLEAARLGARIVRVHAPAPVRAALRESLPPPLRLECTGSTNDDAMRLAREGAPDGSCVVAERQTAGRGRAGHAWSSPPGVALYFSSVFRPSLPPERLALATLALGVAVAEALEEVSGLPTRVKWPNDILVDGRKCCGLLCEADLVAPGGPVVVAGVGVNVNNDPADLPPRPIFPATSLKAEAGRAFPREPVLAACRTAMGRWISVLAAPGGPSAVLSRLASLDALCGRAIAVSLPDGSVLRGTASGIDETGRLLVTPPSAPLPSPVVAGSVSLC